MFASGCFIREAIVDGFNGLYIEGIYCILFAALLIGIRTLIATELI
jgi:hypothetical protein